MMSIGRLSQTLVCILSWVFLLTCDGVLITSAGAPASVDSNLSALLQQNGNSLYSETETGPATFSAYSMPTPGAATNMEMLSSVLSSLQASQPANELSVFEKLLQQIKNPQATLVNKLSYEPQAQDRTKIEGFPYDLKFLTTTHLDDAALATTTTRPSVNELLQQLQQRLSQEGVTVFSTASSITGTGASQQPQQQQKYSTPGIPRSTRKRPEPSDSAVPVLASSSVVPLWTPTSSSSSPTTNLVFVISPEMATRAIKNLMGSISEELVPSTSIGGASPQQPPTPNIAVNPRPNSMSFKFETLPLPQQLQPLLPPSILPPNIPMSNEYLKETVIPYLTSLATAQAVQKAIYPNLEAAFQNSGNKAPYVDPVAVGLMAAAQQHINRHGWHNPSQHAMVNQFMSTITPALSADAGQLSSIYTSLGAGLGAPGGLGVRVGGTADIGSFLSNLGLHPQNNAAALSGSSGKSAPGSISGLVAMTSAAQASSEQASR